MPIATRRSFIKGCLAAGAAGSLSRIGFAGGAASGFNDDILVVVFLRGGCDGLNLVPPLDGAQRALYEAARPAIAVPDSGEAAAWPLDGQFGLHPATVALRPFWDDGKLAVVHAVGMHDPTRSHFEAEDFLELGTPGSKSVSSGWLHRHLASTAKLPAEILIPALAAGYYQPTSLLGSTEALTLVDATYFDYLWGPWQWHDAERTAQRRLYTAGSSEVHAAGVVAMNAVDVVHAFTSDSYVPGGGAVYPQEELGELLSLAAQLIKAEVGIQVVTVDHGGFDTHEEEGDGGGGQFGALVRVLADALAAFATDLEASGHFRRLTIVTMTEFGRRVEENANRGTDHGHAAPMLLLGGNVVGGVHGTFPGLEPENMFEGIDVEVTTDFRRVLSEVLIRRLGNPQLGTVFPGYSEYRPLGVVRGDDLAPVYGGGSGAAGRLARRVRRVAAG